MDGANYSSLCDVNIPYQGKVLHFRGLGMFKTFMYEDKYYIYHNAQDKEMITYKESEKLTREDANRIHRNHWYIEEYHRVLKPLCNFEGMIFRSGIRIVNHIFYSIKAFCILEITRFEKGLKNWYATITNDTIKYTADMMHNLSLS
ncbi:MAG: hypothetical protein LBG52_09390 [Candidatus Peribacteria bacterium]|nr:hypothetical protein [Candidatus Peribacteria bacterium]